jgi:curved DNA-binding protein CbpA
MADAHATLGLAPGASLDEAEEAYYRLLRLEHPDLHQGAGPERVAQAEQRTRELNAAISALRDRAAATAAAGVAGGAAAGGSARGTSTRGASRPDAGSRTDPGSGDAGSDPGFDGRFHAGFDATSGPTRVYAAPRPTVDCPWCGEPFSRQIDLKAHVLVDHDLRLDRRERRRFLGGRVHRALHAAGHLPLWAVIPLNVLLAVVVALLVTVPTDESVGLWAGFVTLAPTFAALLDRGFDASR